MQGNLCFILILPDGSKSLIPAEWTDFTEAIPARKRDSGLIGSLDDLLQLRSLADALLQRGAAPAPPSVPEQESHAATESELPRHPHPANTPVGEPQSRAPAALHRDAGASNGQGSRATKQATGAGQ